MNTIKKIWNYLFGRAKDFLRDLLKNCVVQAVQITKDKQIMALAFEAVKTAATDKLTGEQAFDAAKEKFIAALKESGKELSQSTINYIIEMVYSSWKSLDFKESEK